MYHSIYVPPKYHFSTFRSIRLSRIFPFIILVAALPLTVFISLHIQELRNRAATFFPTLPVFAHKLTWPPPQLTNPVTINLTTTHQNLNLDNTKDYILKFPNTPIVGVFNEYDVLYITGGHNIVMIGGEINVPDLPDTLNGVNGNNNQRQAMRLNNQTGIVFIEGLEVSGTCMDFMDITAPQATVILQNVRVEQCRSHFESLSGGYTDEHPDLIQPWGGAKEIDIDGFTGFTDYQGFQLDSDLGVVGNIVIKHANIGRINTPGVSQYGRYYMWEGCNTNICGTDLFSPSVPHWDLTDDSFYIQPADNKPLGKSAWPDSGFASPLTAVIAADGQSISWPNYTAKINGRVRLGPPATGDFVPEGSVGIGYISPGYLNGSTPTPNPLATNISLTICPHGLGNCGDNANPSSGGNTNPLHTTRIITLNLTDINNNKVPGSPFQRQITYVSSSQNFQGSVSIPNLLNGQYLVRIKMDGYLEKQFPGIITLTQGQQVNLPEISLVTGDIGPVPGTNNTVYGDNQLDITDYNVLISCFGSKMTTSSCLNPPTQLYPGADILDDDGQVDGGDYNLFLREFSVQHGGL